MVSRYLAVIASFILIAVLASCAQPGGGEQPPGPSEYATVAESVAVLDTLMADAVSIASGYVSNELLTSIQSGPCLLCDFPGIPSFAYPALFWLQYDYFNGESPEDGRLATGTYAYDDIQKNWMYTEAPADGLVIVWTDIGTGEEIEIRFAWKALNRATTYSEPAPPPIPFVSQYAYPYSTELDVPVLIEISIDHGSQQVLFLEVKQELVDTGCGQLAEAKRITASGFFESGPQRLDLDNFSYDRTMDDRLLVSIDATVKNGSIVIPVGAEFTLIADKTTRDAATCELRTIEPPYAGTLKVSAGDGSGGVGFTGSWNLEFNSSEPPEPTILNVTETMIAIGGKRVDISGLVGINLTGALHLESFMLTFAESVSLPLTEFGELLTFPTMP